MQIRVERIDKQWSGSLHVGLTTLPLTESTPHDTLPATASQLKKKPTWIATGVDVIKCGQVTRACYATILQRLEVTYKLAKLSGLFCSTYESNRAPVFILFCFCYNCRLETQLVYYIHMTETCMFM